MPGSEAELRELDELRHKLTEYEAALRSAAPRLAAFKRLEQLARTQGTSPEAIASQAAVEVMKREKDALVTLLAGLANERDQLKGEVAMLLINKTEAGKAVADLHLEREDLAIEVAAIVDQLAKLRGDAVQLLSDKTELTVEVAALREEVRALHDAFQQVETARAEQEREIEALRRRHDDVVIEELVVDDGALDTDTSSETGVDSADDEETLERADREISPEAEALAAELEEIKSAKQRRETLVPRKTFASTIETDEETEELESQAFDAFFHAEIDHDKSRDWILG
ncbi:MAG: hypothetical protein R2733_10505 [Acidimicrobiales bacterium]